MANENVHHAPKLATPLLQTRLIQYKFMDFNEISYTAPALP